MITCLACKHVFDWKGTAFLSTCPFCNPEYWDALEAESFYAHTKALDSMNEQ